MEALIRRVPGGARTFPYSLGGGYAGRGGAGRWEIRKRVRLWWSCSNFLACNQGGARPLSCLLTLEWYDLPAPCKHAGVVQIVSVQKLWKNISPGPSYWQALSSQPWLYTRQSWRWTDQKQSVPAFTRSPPMPPNRLPTLWPPRESRTNVCSCSSGRIGAAGATSCTNCSRAISLSAKNWRPITWWQWSTWTRATTKNWSRNTEVKS